jgi:hypothetical protein
VLVQTLVVISAVTALMAIMAADEQASMRQTQARLDDRRAEKAVDAAVARAMASLQSANANLVTLNDSWATVGQNGVTPNNQSTLPSPAEYQLYDSDAPDQSAPTFRMQIVDAGALINLNADALSSSLPAQQRAQAQQSFQQQLLNLSLTQQQIDCLMDWEETSQQPRSDGAKDQFYNSLQQPYNTKLGALDTVDEVLLVDNWTAQILYQPATTQTSTNPLPTDAQGNILPLASLVTVDSGAPNTQADGSARINVTSPTANLGSLGFRPNQINQVRQARSFQQLLSIQGVSSNQAQQLLDRATFSTGRLTGKINLNTASQSVLMSVPGMTSSIASAIMTQQQSGFTSLGALASVSGVTLPVLRQMADAFTVASDTWIVRAYGHSGNVGVAVEAVVGIRNSRPQVITWERLNTPTVPTWWDWQDTSTTIDAAQNT